MKSFFIENTGREEGRDEIVSVGEFSKQCNLKILYGDENSEIRFSTISVNRPGLFITGYEEYFASSRVQVMGNAEVNYLYGLAAEERIRILRKLFSKGIPCLILSRGIKPMKELPGLAAEYNVPVFLSLEITSEVINNLVVYLNKLLAPSISLHSVFVNINGIGVALIGDSGIGKSETALELLHRGHRLISDDAVVIKRIGNELIGYSPEVTNGFMEIRGVGIIDVRQVFGIGAVQSHRSIDLIIELEHWQQGKHYDRVGKEMQYMEILDIKVPKIVIPVSAGRNLAIVIEVAAGNFNLRKSGYIAAETIEKRLK